MFPSPSQRPLPVQPPGEGKVAAVLLTPDESAIFSAAISVEKLVLAHGTTGRVTPTVDWARRAAPLSNAASVPAW